ncbi:MAG: metallophosphoesterase [Pseudomonadota bacterium]
MGYRFAHLSDCHLGPLPPARFGALLSKRLFGYLNWKKNRAKAFDPAVTDRLIDDVQRQSPDHTIVTGDLINIALPGELQNARNFLENLGASENITIVPGNHDAYVPGALEAFNVELKPYLASDHPYDRGDIYPVLRTRGLVRLIGLSSAISTPPLMATGEVAKGQLAAMQAALDESAETFNVVMVHHPPAQGAAHWHKRLVNLDEVAAALSALPVHLVLHGHTHLPTKTIISGDHGPILVFGVSSAAQAVGGHKPPASYTLFDVNEIRNGYELKVTRRGYSKDPDVIVELSREDMVFER